MKQTIRSFGKELSGFVRTIKPLLLVYFLTLGAFSLVYLFGRLPAAFWWYSVQLSAFLVVILLLIRYYAFAKDQSVLRQLQVRELSGLEELSSSRLPSDRRYAELLCAFEQQLKETEERAAEKNSDQRDYFTLWLHQMKTPISAASLLMQRTENRVLAQKVQQELFRIEEYTSMALSYVKIEDTGADLDFEHFPLDEVIRKSVKRYSIMFIYNRISLDYEDVSVSVLSDRRWLQVLLEQLVSNALKYSPGGKLMIYMHPEREKTLVIEDTGIGIRPEDLPRIFNKGYSAFKGQTYEKSTGLGLFLSRKISRRLGHGLSIDSILDVGTQVYIDFSRESLETSD